MEKNLIIKDIGIKTYSSLECLTHQNLLLVKWWIIFLFYLYNKQLIFLLNPLVSYKVILHQFHLILLVYWRLSLDWYCVEMMESTLPFDARGITKPSFELGKNWMSIWAGTLSEREKLFRSIQHYIHFTSDADLNKLQIQLFYKNHWLINVSFTLLHFINFGT